MNEVKNLSAFPGIAADGRLIKPRDPFAYAQCDGKIGKNADKSEYIFLKRNEINGYSVF